MKEKIVKTLNEIFPAPRCELEYETNVQLLVAVILSAQCTDKRVNLVTKSLFKRCKTASDFANIPQEELEKLIRSCGFYHAKAKSIKTACEEINFKYNGEVPGDFDKLCSLRGVGRKTANVIISEGFKGDALAVDTHVLRVSNRLGLVKTQNPTECEFALKKYFDKKDWSRLHYQMVLFGRYHCKSRNPLCKDCKFFEMCKYKEKNVFR